MIIFSFLKREHRTLHIQQAIKSNNIVKIYIFMCISCAYMFVYACLNILVDMSQ